MSTEKSNLETPPSDDCRFHMRLHPQGILKITLEPGAFISGHARIASSDSDAAMVFMTEEEADSLNLAAVFDALAGAGIEAVHGEFDGCSDSGQIEELYAVAGGQTVELPSGPLTHIYCEPRRKTGKARLVKFKWALEYVLLQRLDNVLAGWELDMGSCGDFCFDVEKRQLMGELFLRGDCDAVAYEL